MVINLHGMVWLCEMVKIFLEPDMKIALGGSSSSFWGGHLYGAVVDITRLSNMEHSTLENTTPLNGEVIAYNIDGRWENLLWFTYEF